MLELQVLRDWTDRTLQTGGMNRAKTGSKRIRGGRDPLGTSRVLDPPRDDEAIAERHRLALELDAQRRERVRESVTEVCVPSELTGGRVLEIGCGHGHFLTAYAKKFPQSECIGLDYSRPRIDRGKRKVAANGLSNLHFIHGSATDFLDARPSWYEFTAVYILFPDPWPKRRHRKYRLINPDFLANLAGAASPDAALYFRTDSEDYFREARRTISEHSDWMLSDDAEWPFEYATVFEKKAAQFESLRAVRSLPAK